MSPFYYLFQYFLYYTSEGDYESRAVKIVMFTHTNSYEAAGSEVYYIFSNNLRLANLISGFEF